MIIEVGKTGTVEEAAGLLTSVCQHESVRSVLMLACDENRFTPETLDPVLRGMEVPVFGGVFPQIVYETDCLSRGCIVAGLSHEADVHVIRGLSDETADFEAILEDHPVRPDVQTLFVFVDGLSTRLSALIDGLFNIVGMEHRYIGGGAGSLSFVQKPCLLTRDGMVQDGAVFAAVNAECSVGVSHGWTEIGGPFQVTESCRNVIRTLDWRPAFRVYRDVVEGHSGQFFTEQNFFDLSKRYPFGISRLDAETVVRDPLRTDPDGSLVCVGEVPQECYVHILTGNTNSLVQAAREAMETGTQAFRRKPEFGTTLFIDCISRALFLEDQFAQELEAVHNRPMPLIGALTLGEIANNGQTYLEFYNKTSVVGILED